MFQRRRMGHELLWALDRILAAKAEGFCQLVGADRLRGVLDMLIRDPQYERERATLLALQARLYAVEGNYSQAILSSDESIRLKPDIMAALQKVDFALEERRFGEARQFLSEAEQIMYGQSWRHRTCAGWIQGYREMIDAQANGH